MEQEHMEQQIWEYIDGTCTEEARIHIAGMIAKDPAWAKAYEQLLSLHTTLPHQAALEQPSMRFTKNVMEIVAGTPVAKATRRFVNPIIVGSIFAFFALSFIAILVYAFSSANTRGSTINLPEVNLGGLLNNTTLSILGWTNVVLLLLLVDMYLRKRKMRSRQADQA